MACPFPLSMYDRNGRAACATRRFHVRMYKQTNMKYNAAIQSHRLRLSSLGHQSHRKIEATTALNTPKTTCNQNGKLEYLTLCRVRSRPKVEYRIRPSKHRWCEQHLLVIIVACARSVRLDICN